ncbi:MAG: glycosyltransferase family 2 protein [Longimicrobiales bacterium]|nr:glycosyltransferase family 2 protein [Longimicrobiales bacterium]
MFWILLGALPWVLVLGFLALGVRLPHPLPPSTGTPEGGAGRVSVVIPARNEARNIERVMRTVAASDHPDVEILVVDDRSEDATAEIARRVASDLAATSSARIRVIEGAELPEGWLGKPWACAQGGEAATGAYLLFTDADTRHAPDLLRRAVAELEATGAEVLSLAGRQLMESFWERVVQPQIFTSMLFRYADLRDPLPPARFRDAVANGQYILFRRDTWEAIGGHAMVRGEVVEDLKLAQHLVRLGHTLLIRMAEDAFATRMYTSLDALVRGWSKNIVLGGMATLPPGPLRRVAPAAIFLGTLLLWIAPPVILAVAVVMGAETLAQWSATVVGISLLFWGAVSWRMEVSPLHAFAYPLGAGVGAWIYLRAWVRGGDVEWKGRRYRVRGVADPGEPGGL